MKQAGWEEKALRLFRQQADQCQVYRSYLNALNCRISEINNIEEIPFLPIELFKSYEVKTGLWKSQHVFRSSGTTSSVRATHHVQSMETYLNNTKTLFELTYGSLKEYAIFALLPGYAPESSLVSMVQAFIAESAHPDSGFYTDEADFESLYLGLEDCCKKSMPTLLIGVTFSLLDFVADHQIGFPELIVLETGGMKGRKIELVRSEIHQKIKKAFGVEKVHSEYGMTEMFSQAYSTGHGIFKMNNQLKVIPGDLYDPLATAQYGSSCRLNVIDVANASTCAFISTNDIGKVHKNGDFEVLGRQDFSEIRGCNLLML